LGEICWSWGRLHFLHQDDAEKLFGNKLAVAACDAKTECMQGFACAYPILLELVFSPSSQTQVSVADHAMILSARIGIMYPLNFAVWCVPVPFRRIRCRLK